MPVADWGLGELVYRASLLLLYPTLIALSVCFLQMMWHLGELVQDAWTLRSYRRQRTARRLRDIRLDQQGSPVPSLSAVVEDHSQPPQLRRFVAMLVEELDRPPRHTLAARIDHLIGQTEASLAHDVNRVRVHVRLGPCLGLAGTLIPLGPGLMALGQGDVGRLSTQLVVAFSTTVVGLLIGGVSYVIAMARAHTADLVSGDVELVGDMVCILLGVQAEGKPAGRTVPNEAKEISA